MYIPSSLKTIAQPSGKMSEAHPKPTNTPQPAKSKSKSKTQIEEDDEGGNRFVIFNVMPSWLVSFITHIAVIVVLAIVIMPSTKIPSVALETSDQTVEAAESIDMNLDFELDAETSLDEASDMPEDNMSDVADSMDEVEALPEEQFEMGDLMAADQAFDSEDMGMLGDSDLVEETGGRSGDSKKRMMKKYGATAASEEAVALALKWIARHQLPDGGWSLDHRIGPGNFRTSPNPGTLSEARNGATALALLPFLGAGSTHQTGEYKDVVRNGLDFLMRRAKGGGRGVSYLEPGGTMYSHGLVSIVFCEAYGMTKDPELGKFAQATVWYIEDAQDPSGGGWRYAPRQRGDTSAVGWQLMALKSGKITGLDIRKRTYQLAEKFLDSVSHTEGAYYGYADPPPANYKPANAQTAVGLLCRMYMGWDKNMPGLVEGMNAIAEKGPSINASADMYYNYYATQAMKHMGGKDWDQWNKKMRDFLVKSQSKDGNSIGSWHFGESHTPMKGGRLYTTSLACMTLEVYYRYLPLYGDKASNAEFPLE
ncbi:MAG: prenyltransferase/squalene oxidase repeat-containing protein [Mariniblastus sp.]